MLVLVKINEITTKTAFFKYFLLSGILPIILSFSLKAYRCILAFVNEYALFTECISAGIVDNVLALNLELASQQGC